MYPVAIAASAQDVVLSGPIVAAILFAVAAGLISFFTPCVLPLVPVYLAYVTGVAGEESRSEGPRAGALQSGSTVLAAPRIQARTPARSRTLIGAALFVLGFAVVFTSYGALFGTLGQTLGRHQDDLIRVSGLVTVLMGLIFAGALARVPGMNRTVKPSLQPRVGLTGAPILGGLFAIGWTPCIGPTLAAVLTLSTTTATAERGALLTFAYSLGLGIPFLVAAATVGRATRTFSWMRTHAREVTRAGGLLLVVIGLMQLTGIWSTTLAAVQSLVVGWPSPL